MPSLACLIPARFGSTRLPGKPLALLGGKALIARTIGRAKEAGIFLRIVVVSDHVGILHEAKEAGAEVVLIDEPCASGTDRIAKALPFIEEEFVLNLQADEPFILPSLLKALGDGIVHEGRDGLIYTSAAPILRWEEFEDPNRVKVVMDTQGRALYFSRSPVPYQQRTQEGPKRAFVHNGAYAMSRRTLELFSGLPPATLEEIERLEQLRALGHGFEFRVIVAPTQSFGIDTPEDLQKAEASLLCGQSSSL
jgi:3-deoxy-manno-octulosonate cytidylyltransferase (CMP-KDO synthetase)